jgi:hypothetical protein
MVNGLEKINKDMATPSDSVLKRVTRRAETRQVREAPKATMQREASVVALLCDIQY